MARAMPQRSNDEALKQAHICCTAASIKTIHNSHMEENPCSHNLKQRNVRC